MVIGHLVTWPVSVGTVNYRPVLSSERGGTGHMGRLARKLLNIELYLGGKSCKSLLRRQSTRWLEFIKTDLKISNHNPRQTPLVQDGGQ
jgi:hypothetical protein